jgi:CO/xanthine dehydrogenase Mo-binding subunit/aerobic-type carbon monoxide dehydrogenase small subunit (CoxS/CutS family)
MRLCVNDHVHEVPVEPHELLVDTLRERLGSTGTKQACGMGNCGTCTVRLGGQTVYACLVLTMECDDQPIETIEGLAEGDDLDPVQQAFVDADAFQCGFCTPGQIMSLRALLDEVPDPSEDEVVRGMSGNLCRCGAYRHILAAARLAVDGGTVTADAQARPRVEAVAKATGRARYGSDMQLAGQLEAAILRSRAPHARVRAVDIAKARHVPGVQLVLTADDVDDVRWYDEQVPILATTARFVGDELAVVVGDSRRALDEALTLLAVQDEALPHVTDVADAAEPGAVIVMDGDEDNVIGDAKRYERGDVSRALRNATHVVEATYTTPMQVHHALESHGATAEWDGTTLTVYDSTQSVHDVRDGLADALGLPVNRVRVIAEHIGGGFGAKQVAWKPTALAALLAMRTGRPVRLFADRHAEALAHGRRNPTRQTVRLGADADGNLLAIDADILIGAGAYTVGGEDSTVEGPYQYLYGCADVRTVKSTVRTNLGPTVAFRAPGYVEGVFALESAMDELALAIGIDPVELRRRNLVDHDQVDDLPLSSPEALAMCIARATERFDWSAGSTRSVPPVCRGRGFAVHDWMAGKGILPGYAHVVFTSDGSVQVVCGSQDIGTGTRTVLAQIAADALGVDVARVTVVLGDTAVGLLAPVSAGSSTVPTMGPAVHEAATNARQALVVAAAEHLEVAADQVDWDRTRFRRPGGSDVGLAEVLDAVAPRTISGDGAREALPEDVSIRTFGAVCAEVDVDVTSGRVTVARIVTAPDCGRLVNPLLARSQVIGGVTQGLGYALTEHDIIDHQLGVVLNANLEDYLVPTMADSCEIVHAEVDLPDQVANPLGTKGLGELPMIAVAPAIANAVYDAVGVRIRELPITRQRMLDALAKRELR